MTDFLQSASDLITRISDFVCGYPLFLLLIGGGLYLFFYSGCVSLRCLGRSVKALRHSEASAEGQISSVQALMSAIASTVGMGNIAGVAIAITVGGPGAIFWMWVSAVVGMSTKFFEGALSIMYRGHDSAGQPQGGTMYTLVNGLGAKWRPLATFFAVVGLIGTLCVMQANQLVESVTTVFTTPAGIANTPALRFAMGVVIALIVGSVIVGGIKRISAISSKIVPVMVGGYMLLVFVIVCLNIERLPEAFASIFRSAFSMEAGIGGILGTALTGARRAAYVNEAGVGTAGMMHGASRNDNPLREGFVAMIGPAIDSGLVCTLTALPILLAGNYTAAEGIKGLYIALNSFEALLPGWGQYLLMVMVFFFAFSTMFSYSYYGLKCTNFLFGAHRAKYYNYFYLVMIVVAAVVPLGTVVAVMDLSFALMALPTMTSLLLLAPRVKRLMKQAK
ncbi:MAG: alanine/glycine:cation symporter family protein [Bacteroides sp.]